MSEISKHKIYAHNKTNISKAFLCSGNLLTHSILELKISFLDTNLKDLLSPGQLPLARILGIRPRGLNYKATPNHKVEFYTVTLTSILSAYRMLWGSVTLIQCVRSSAIPSSRYLDPAQMSSFQKHQDHKDVCTLLLPSLQAT